MFRRFLSSSLACGLPLMVALAAHAQAGVSPEAAPAAPEVGTPQVNPMGQSETTPVNPPPATPGETAPDEKGQIETAPAAAPARLQAASVSYEGATIIARGTPDAPVRFESAAGLILAQEVRLETLTKRLSAQGQVQFERERLVTRNSIRQGRLAQNSTTETVRETAFGNNLNYDFLTGKGQIDNARLNLATLEISTESLIINGKNYTAKNIVLRPGGQTEAENKIYGVPPLSIRADTATTTPIEKNGQPAQRVTIKGGGLYFKNTRILPIPTYSFTSGGGKSDNETRLTPGVSLNSGDRFLVTTELLFPLDKTDPQKLSARADIGLSARVGLRGGAGLTSTTNLGRFALDFRRSDVVSSQLTNRIELDRKPELTYSSPSFATFNLGRSRAGLAFDASLGDFTERFIGAARRTSATRAQARLVFSTRLRPGFGPYLRLFSEISRYSGSDDDYRNNGFEIGYDGQLLPRLNGQISLRATNVEGETPFRFDSVEIRRELRATVDYQLNPRYIIPLDLRYDLGNGKFRDETFGVLRSYKTFAYGITYQTARRDLRLEVRNGF